MLRFLAVKPDKSSWERQAEGSAKRIREALQKELTKQNYRLREIEAGVARGKGYFYKYTGGLSNMTIDMLFDTLDLLGLDAGRFLAHALGVVTSAEAVLEDLERFGKIERGLRQIEKATEKLEVSEPGAPPKKAGDAAALVKRVTACGGVERRRRLGAGDRYRSGGFARAYVEYLDAFRYDDPRDAALDAKAVAVKLVPRLGEPQAERLALQARAIGVYGSAQRQRGRYATAARAVRVALELARRYELEEETARLLQRGAYVLSDHGRHEAAMGLLDEALLIYFDLDLQLGLGRVLVDRGFVYYHQADYESALNCLSRGIAVVERDVMSLPRTLLAAYQILGLVHKELGELDQAEDALARAAETVQEPGEVNRAKLAWLRGDLACERNAYADAEERFCQAREILEQCKSPDAALVSLDLTKTLLAQGKGDEAIELAVEMVNYLSAFPRNKVLRAAVPAFAQAAVAGRLSLARVEDLQAKFRAARPQGRDFAPSGRGIGGGP